MMISIVLRLFEVFLFLFRELSCSLALNAQHAHLLGREALKLALPRFGPSAEADILLREASSTSILRTAMFAAEGGGLPSSLRRATGPEARVGSAIAPATSNCPKVGRATVKRCQQSKCELHGGRLEQSSRALILPSSAVCSSPKPEPSSILKLLSRGAMRGRHVALLLRSLPQAACLRATDSEDILFVNATVVIAILAIIWVESPHRLLLGDDNFKHGYYWCHHGESNDVVTMNP